MKIWVGVTDKKWFDFLAAQQPTEANFWQPSASQPFRLQPGELFLFKLHSPQNYIAGGGFFVRFTALPVSLAWSAFGQCNGVDTLDNLILRLKKYRRDERAVDPTIGCNLLSEPFFWPRDQWIPIPPDWAKNIVRGKSYDTEEIVGARLLTEVQARLSARPASADVNEENAPRYGSDYIARARLGQGTFRVLVTDAYARRCAMTGERTLPVLEAAHIKPYAKSGPHQIRNGILLRSDIHTLFDRGYITVTPSFVVEVSPRIKEEFENGREYYSHHGRQLKVMPPDSKERPSPEFLRWHNDEIFLA